MLKQKQERIKAKGFNLIENGIGPDKEDEEIFEEMDYSKMRVGLRTIDDVVVNLGTYKKVNPNYGDKNFVLRAIYNHDYATLREISNYFYESNGIYYRLCRYMAHLYRYDWYVTPYESSDSANEKKLLKDFSQLLLYLDKSSIKRVFSSIALDVMRDGVYYGIMVDFGDKVGFQKLPANYCRTRYFAGVDPIVELNLQFFDAYFTNIQHRLQILKTFPKDLQQAYVLFKQGKLKGDYPGDRTYWYALDPGVTVKVCLNGGEFPPMVGVIPSLIDLDSAQDLDRKKTMQQLLKIIVQKLPLDKNGDLIFDVDEARDIHNNAVAMLKRSIGVDVLTTFADVDTINTKDTNSQTTKDDLEKVERTVFNNSGISSNLFNADGNLAVTNSILTDEASIREIPDSFKALLDKIIEKFNRKNQYEFRASILGTTQYNYINLAKLYKEDGQMGYHKMLPMIALGHSQADILATLRFENEVLHLAEIMIPPMTSNVQSSKNLGGNNQNNQTKIQNKQTTIESSGGRPQKEDQDKSDKTIANQESAS